MPAPAPLRPRQIASPDKRQIRLIPSRAIKPTHLIKAKAEFFLKKYGVTFYSIIFTVKKLLLVISFSPYLSPRHHQYERGLFEP
jgi:hypothetical protein